MEHHDHVNSVESYSQCEEAMDLRRGPWTVDEDFTLISYITRHGEGRWNSLARCAGLKRTGKSCRLRWLNYLRPDVRRGNITLEEQLMILELHSKWGNRWSKIAQHLPGRTDNEIKNYWRTQVQKHARRLRCDVNSKQFKDTMRYLWMPRLLERIRGSATTMSEAAATSTNTSAATNAASYNLEHQANIHLDMNTSNMVQSQTNMVLIHPNGGFRLNPSSYTSETSSTAASSGTYGAQGSHVSSTADCYDYAVDGSYNQQYYPTNPLSSGESSTSHNGYVNQESDYHVTELNATWMDGGDLSDSLWNVDDMWFLQ